MTNADMTNAELNTISNILSRQSAEDLAAFNKLFGVDGETAAAAGTAPAQDPDPTTAKKRKPGPKTPEAKARTKYNASRHGFTGQVLIMSDEERPLFVQFVTDMLTALAPVGIHEKFVANSMAQEAWRMNQIRAYSDNIAAVGQFDELGGCRYDDYNPRIQAAVVDTIATRGAAKELALMSLYAQRAHRAYEKFKKELRELQEERKTQRAKQLEEARLLFELAETENLPFFPEQEGFVFSNREVRDHTERHYRLQRARFASRKYRESQNLKQFPHLPKAA